MQNLIFGMIALGLTPALSRADGLGADLIGPYVVDVCQDKMPVAQEHCSKGVQAVEQAASPRDSDTDIDKAIQTACLAPGMDAGIEQTCREAAELKLQEKFGCGMGTFITSGGRVIRSACNAGVAAVKALKLSQANGYSAALKMKDDAVAAACPKSNRFLAADCTAEANDTFNEAVGACGDTPLRIVPSDDRMRLNPHVNRDGHIYCVPGTYKVAGAKYSVKLDSDGFDASFVTKVETADGTSFTPQFSPSYQDFYSKQYGFSRDSHASPSCTELQFEANEIVCIGEVRGHAYRGTASVVKSQDSAAPTTPPAEVKDAGSAE